MEDLLAFGADAADLDALTAYAASPFTPVADAVPLPDEPFVAVWRAWAQQAEDDGAFATLSRHLPQLAFPIAAGMSQTSDYRDATLRGADVSGLPGATGLKLEQPEALRLVLHDTPAGAVPALLPRGRADFESLVRALAGRNEPVALLPSMGACTVQAYNDWERLRDYQASWMCGHPGEDWGAELARLQAHREVYQDRFLILSDGDYSGVPAAQASVEASAWREMSARIRLLHECTHYVTLRLMGSARNNAIDELICDFVGFSGVMGRFDARLFLRGMGISVEGAGAPGPSTCTEGGRLRQYASSLTPTAFPVLCGLVREAALTLERFDAARPRTNDAMLDSVAFIWAMGTTSVVALAGDGGLERLLEAFARARAEVRRRDQA